MRSFDWGRNAACGTTLDNCWSLGCLHCDPLLVRIYSNKCAEWDCNFLGKQTPIHL